MKFKIAILVFAAWSVSVLVAEPKQKPGQPATSTETESAVTVISEDEARGRAELLHTMYLRTLHTMHREYFRDNDRLTVPSRALEGVFSSVDRRSGGKTRWIAVNAPAMNIEHKPSTAIEKEAALALKGGESVYEKVVDGVYHRVGAITLFASCTRCHLGALANQRPGRRVAGLAISLPLALPEKK